MGYYSAIDLIDRQLETTAMNIRGYDDHIKTLTEELSVMQTRKAAEEELRDGLEADRETLRLALIAKTDHAIRVTVREGCFRL